MRDNSHAAGFTLIELSIALVIIGLVVGGVLVGRDLIHAAEIRATVAQVEKFNAAVNTFRNKYNCLPGDCASPADFGFEAASAGNADGMIGLCSRSAACRWSGAPGNGTNALQAESVNFWYQLSASGLIPDNFPYGMLDLPGTVTPKAKMAPILPGGWCIQADAQFDASYGGGGFPAHSFALCSYSPQPSISNFGIFAPADIQAIDIKLDDGLPLSGTVRTFAFGWIDYLGNHGHPTGAASFGGFPGFPGFGTGPGGPNSLVCVANNVTPSQYNVQWAGSASGFLCGILIKAAF